LLPPSSVNQRAPSGPDVMPTGALPDVGMAYSVKAPLELMRPIMLLPSSVNQLAPSGLDAMSYGKLFDVGVAYS